MGDTDMTEQTLSVNQFPTPRSAAVEVRRSPRKKLKGQGLEHDESSRDDSDGSDTDSNNMAFSTRSSGLGRDVDTNVESRARSSTSRGRNRGLTRNLKRKNEKSNEEKRREEELQNAHFKLLFAQENDQFPRAMLNISTNETILVDQDTGTYTSDSSAINLDMKNRLEVVNSLMKTIFEGVKLHKGQWYSGDTVPTETSPEDIKYHSEIPIEKVVDLEKQYNLNPGLNLVEMCSSFRAAFLLPPSLSNGNGREALCNLCTVLKLMCIPDSYKRLLVLSNVGGGGNSNPWEGNSIIGYITDQHDYSEDKIAERLQKKPDKTRVHNHTPDFQVRDRFRFHFYVTGEVKSKREYTGSSSVFRSQQQAWEQALTGLRVKDESYAILLTPLEAVLFELRIEDPAEGSSKRCLQTNSKVYRFVDASRKFNVDALKDLMGDIVGLMYKLAKMFMLFDEYEVYRKMYDGDNKNMESQFSF